MVNLPIEYSDKAVTPFGGMALLKRFVDKVGIREFLDELDLPSPGSNRGYTSKQIIESFWLNIWTGASRYVHCNWLRNDEVIKEIFGFKSMPSQSTYSRFFGKFSLARNTEVFPKLQQWFFQQMSLGTITVDFDSTVITREGKQQGSAKGYNPNRRGRNSHHPLIAFVSESRMIANAWLRPGNTAASSNCEEFMRETFEHALAGQKVGLVRADSGFYTESLLGVLEERQLNYIIATRLYPNVKSKIRGLSDWVEICEGIEAAEFTHQFQNEGAKERKHFVIRKHLPRRPEAGGKLLFADDFPDYRYSVYVTNLDLPEREMWNVYNGRADCENRIKELKQDFGLESFCLQDFWGTEASFRFIIVAYNLLSLFRHQALNEGKTATMKTLKPQCFAIGAWSVKHAKKHLLKLSLPHPKRSWMDGILAKIEGLSPPFCYSSA